MQIRGKTQISSSEVMSLIAARLFDSEGVRRRKGPRASAMLYCAYTCGVWVTKCSEF